MKLIKKLLSTVTSTVIAATCLSSRLSGLSDSIRLLGEPLIAQAEMYGDYLYYQAVDENGDGISDSAEITDCEDSVISVEIPSEIDGLPVTSIGYSAFRGCINLTSVAIPDSVKRIEPYAFTSCKSLDNIKLPDGIKSIGKMAFGNCKSLEGIWIPEGIKVIEEMTFSGCTELSFVVIQENVESIEKDAFAYCLCLECIIIWNPDCKFYNGRDIIYNYKSGDELILKGIIYGKAQSTAETYADKFNYKFLEFNEYGPIGDVDGDNKVTAKDASLLFTQYKRIYNGGYCTFTDNQLGRCDVNGDKKITAIDASKAFSIYKKNYRKG